jgi:hypothetical protein
LALNLAKEVKVIYHDNCATLMKEVEEGTRRWKHIPYSWIGIINTVKMSILHYPK